MQKYVPYEKLSKKEKKKVNQLRRKGWGEINPVTRVSPNPKAYCRAKMRQQENHSDGAFLFVYIVENA